MEKANKVIIIVCGLFILTISMVLVIGENFQSFVTFLR